MAKKKIVKQNGEKTDAWKLFEMRIKKFSDRPVSKWEMYDFMGYVLTLLEGRGGYILSYLGRPGACQEIYLLGRAKTLLGSPSNERFKDYIDWLIKEKLRSRKSWGSFVFLSQKSCQEFRKTHKDTIGRTTPLPTGFIEIAENSGISIKTYGDLAFARMELDDTPSPNYLEMFENLRDAGLNEEELERLE